MQVLVVANGVRFSYERGYGHAHSLWITGEANKRNREIPDRHE